MQVTVSNLTLSTYSDSNNNFIELIIKIQATKKLGILETDFNNGLVEKGQR